MRAPGARWLLYVLLSARSSPGKGKGVKALGPRPSARPSRNAETKAGDKDPPKLRCHLRAKMQTGVGGKHGQAEADFSTVSPVWLCE